MRIRKTRLSNQRTTANGKGIDTEQAATLRAKYKLRTPAALILATAIVQGASADK